MIYYNKGALMLSILIKPIKLLVGNKAFFVVQDDKIRVTIRESKLFQAAIFIKELRVVIVTDNGYQRIFY